jgi:phenylalanyl-tRNA synthetase beta chain
LDPLRVLEERTRNFLAGIGLFETVTSSLTNPRHFEAAGYDLSGALQIHNPLHQDLTLLRPSFLASLLEVLARNERAGARSVLIFEVANLYSHRDRENSPREEKSLGILLAGDREAGWEDSKRALDFYDLKGMLEGYFHFLGIQDYSFSPREHPTFARGARVSAGKQEIGCLGRIAATLKDQWDLGSEAVFAELSLEKLAGLLPRERKFREFPRYPSVERDLAVVVDEGVKVGEVASAIERLGKGLVRQVDLFDLFRGGRIPEGQKNLAFRLTYQSPERTLLSDEVQRLHNEIASEVARKFQGAFQK